MTRRTERKGDYHNYSFWMDKDLRKDLEDLAEKNFTTLSRLIEKVLKDYVKSQKV